MNAVKPETNVEFLVYRAWKTTQWRKVLGLPPNPEQLAVLVRHGTPYDSGKQAPEFDFGDPTAA